MKKESIKREDLRIKMENSRSVIEGTAIVSNQENIEDEDEDEADLTDNNSNNSSRDQQSESYNKDSKDTNQNIAEKEKDLKSLLPTDFDGLIQDVVLLGLSSYIFIEVYKFDMFLSCYIIICRCP